MNVQQLYEKAIKFAEGAKKVVLGFSMIVAILIASLTVELEFDEGKLGRAHLIMNGTWLQRFIPSDYFYASGKKSVH